MTISALPKPEPGAWNEGIGVCMTISCENSESDETSGTPPGTMDCRFESSKSGQGFLDLLDRSSRVSARLRNAIRSAANKKKLPYQTVEAYLEAGEVGRSKMLQIGNLGRKSFDELEFLIAEAAQQRSAATVCSESRSTLNNRNELADELALRTQKLDSSNDVGILRLPLDVFIAQQKTVSTRLSNAISTAVRTGTCTFETVADYLRCEQRQDELRKIENLGRGSAYEFEQLVIQSVNGNSSTSIQVRPSEHGYINVGSIVKEVFSLLTIRQQEVIVGRLLEKKTLEAVASTRGVTRERVRQIEAKSVRILSTKFGTELLESAEIICSRLCKNGLFELSLEAFSKLVTCEIREATIYLAFLKKLDVGQSTLGSFESNVFVRSNYAPRNTWKTMLTEELRTQSLPLILDKVLSSITSVPGFYIRRYFQQKWGPQISGVDPAVPNYGTSRMCIDVLRKAGCPLHTSDVRARICAIFQIDIEEHAINATLGRLREAVITAPGTYALYESLPFTPA